MPLAIRPRSAPAVPAAEAAVSPGEMRGSTTP
jgi:hypothetical protein